ncbi:MAG: phage terminase small subunit [Candidatus Azotimanducaceae bacterium]
MIDDSKGFQDVTNSSDPMATDAGGFGFTKQLIPRASCRECGGFGETMVIFHPSAGYSAQAAKAFKGVSQTNAGIRVLVENKADALDKIARHYGMYRHDDPTRPTDGLTSLLADIQKRGSKAPIATLRSV